MVHNELGLDPYSGVAYVEPSEPTGSVRWDGTGLVLAYKRLEQGRFAWPTVHNGVMRLKFEALFADCAGRGARACGARAWRRDCPRGCSTLPARFAGRLSFITT